MIDTLLRQRYIEAGLIRPNTKELDPIQLNPGAIVFRVNPTRAERIAEELRCLH